MKKTVRSSIFHYIFVEFVLKKAAKNETKRTRKPCIVVQLNPDYDCLVRKTVFKRLHIGYYMISDIRSAPVAGPFILLTENNANVLIKPRFNAHRLTCYMYFSRKLIDTTCLFSLRSNRYQNPTRGTSEKRTSQPERKRYEVCEKCCRNRSDNNYNRYFYCMHIV